MTYVRSGFSRTSVAVVAALVTTVLAADVAAQKRPYDLVMKDVGTTSEALRRNLDGKSTAAAADAERLARLFQETEDFWTPFKTKDAIEAAKGARELATAVAAAVRAKDLEKAKTAASGLGRFCTSCHNAHREQMPDKSYRIRP
jgi:hypothetical protein